VNQEELFSELLKRKFGGRPATSEEKTQYMRLSESWCQLIWVGKDFYIEKNPFSSTWDTELIRYHEGSFSDAKRNDQKKGIPLSDMGIEPVNPIVEKMLEVAFSIPEIDRELLEYMSEEKDMDVAEAKACFQGKLDNLLEEEIITPQRHAKLSKLLGLGSVDPRISGEIMGFLEGEEEE